MTSPIAYVNGTFVPIEQASLHVFDLGVVGGVAVTEMVRTFRHQPFRLDQHLERFTQSSLQTGLDIGITTSDLRRICERLINENAKLIPEHHDLGLIVFVTAGENPTYVGAKRSSGVHSTLVAHTFPLPFELWASTYQAGLHLVTVATHSIPDNVIDPRIKHRSRLHWHLAAREARKIDLGAMAILTDQAGQLTETASGNLCVVDGTTIITPSAHVLEGVSREFAAELAATMGLEFIHAPVSADDLSHADEAFLTSTPHCLLPVTRFNNASIGNGLPGPIFQRLIEAWSNSVATDISEQMQRGGKDRVSG
jgi:branched-subunit amino acid aminotransferase/4-amino-4-deoxychorismate lyase